MRGGGPPTDTERLLQLSRSWGGRLRATDPERQQEAAPASETTSSTQGSGSRDYPCWTCDLFFLFCKRNSCSYLLVFSNRKRKLQNMSKIS